VNGRRISERTIDENVAILEKEFESLTAEEWALLRSLIDRCESGDTALLHQMYEQRYRWEPVSMAQFLYDEYYLGTSCATLYPKLRSDLIDLFTTGDYRECVFSGAIGWGKCVAGETEIYDVGSGLRVEVQSIA